MKNEPKLVRGEKNIFHDVTIAMISRNEEKAIASVIEDIKKNTTGAQILLVDSSSDKTAEIAAKLGAQVIKQFPPKGYGPAMMKALTSAKTQIVVTLDCDDTYPAQYIPTFINYIRSGYDLVDGSRIWRRPKAMPWSHYLANRFFALTAWIVLRIHVSDVHSGMRAYNTKIFKRVKFEYKNSALPVELLLKPIRLKYKFIQLPIEYKIRVGQSTLDRFNSTKWTFIRIFRLRGLKHE